MAARINEDCGLNCCGLGELIIDESSSEACVQTARRAIYIADRGAPPEAAKPQLDEWGDPIFDEYEGEFKGAFLIFSHVGTSMRRASALARYIEQHQLGTVVCAGIKTNPNTGQRLKAYLWALDRPKVKHFMEKKAPKASKETKDESGSI